MDGKHSVFGKVLQGLETLDKLEIQAVNPSNDVPVKPITIDDTIVLINPFRDSIAELLLKEWKVLNEKEKRKDLTKWNALSMASKEAPKNNSVDSIGKYLQIPKASGGGFLNK